MEQSSNEDDRKDDCGDKHDKDDEATTSKDAPNDPIQTAYNVNDLKAFEFNSADDVRQAMKALIKDKNPEQSENVEDCSVTQDIKTNTEVKNECHRERSDGKIVIVNVCKVNKDREVLETRKEQSRKRPGRPPKQGPSKRLKKSNRKNFYCGKIPETLFMKRKRRYEISSDDDSLFSF